MSKFTSILRLVQWGCVSLGMLALPVPFFVDQYWAEIDPNVGGQLDRPYYLSITTVLPIVQEWAHRSMLALCLGAFALCLLGIKRTLRSSVACLGVGLAIVVAACAGRVMNLAPWEYGPPLHTDDGRVYYLMESNFLQGMKLVLARLDDESWLRRKSKVLVQTSFDNPSSWQSVIRPATDDDEVFLATRLAPNGLLLGFRHGQRCYVAYDLGADVRFGWHGIRGVSPFVLLGADTPLHQPDVDRVEKLVREYDPKFSDNGIPRKPQLEEGLAHPNPAVNALARKLLDLR